MAAYEKPQQRKKAESERLRGKGDQIEFIDLRIETLNGKMVYLRAFRMTFSPHDDASSGMSERWEICVAAHPT